MQPAQPAWLSPIHFLCHIFAGWIKREQVLAIEYLQTELAVFRELLGKKRLQLNDVQRRRLAVKGKTLGRSRLEPIVGNVSLWEMEKVTVSVSVSPTEMKSHG